MAFFMSKPVQPIPTKFVYEDGGFGVSSKLESVNRTFCETPQFKKELLTGIDEC